MKPYILPDLAYSYSALEPHYSARLLELHHDKHHKAYGDGVNATLDKLAAARASDDLSAIVGLEKTLAFNLSGHVDRGEHHDSRADTNVLGVSRSMSGTELSRALPSDPR